MQNGMTNASYTGQLGKRAWLQAILALITKAKLGSMKS
jgi:hypothetical protein